MILKKQLELNFKTLMCVCLVTRTNGHSLLVVTMQIIHNVNHTFYRITVLLLLIMIKASLQILNSATKSDKNFDCVLITFRTAYRRCGH